MRNAYNTSAYGSFAYVYDIFMEEIEDQFGIDVSDGCRIVR